MKFNVFMLRLRNWFRDELRANVNTLGKKEETDKHLGEGGTQMFACYVYYNDKAGHRQES
jgi:hypothetical protein